MTIISTTDFTQAMLSPITACLSDGDQPPSRFLFIMDSAIRSGDTRWPAETPVHAQLEEVREMHRHVHGRLA